MKTILLVMGFMMLVAHARADVGCAREAVRAAKENASSANLLQSVQVLDSSASYLVKYEVVLADRVEEPASTEAYEVTLMKSDCSVVSVTPQL